MLASVHSRSTSIVYPQARQILAVAKGTTQAHVVNALFAGLKASTRLCALLTPPLFTVYPPDKDDAIDGRAGLG